MSIPTLIVIYVALLLGALCGVGIYSKCAADASARRTRRTGFSAARLAATSIPMTRTWTVRRCVQCGKTERADCVLNYVSSTSLCAFLDVLGFSDATEQAYDAGTQTQLLTDVANAMKPPESD